jgi:hypothetical protein
LGCLIRGYDEEVRPETKLRVLGVWVDPKLDWKQHIKVMAEKGVAAFEALSRITASTWGAGMEKARLLYTAVVRPAIMYGVQSWHTGIDGRKAKARIQELEKIQNKCLRRVTGAYKRTPRAALEREARVQPIDIYAEALAMSRALKNKGRPITEEIRKVVDAIWEAENTPQNRRQRGRPRQIGPRPRTSAEIVLQRAEQIEARATRMERRAQPGRGPRRRRLGRPEATRGPASQIERWANVEWRKRWKKTAEGKEAITWRALWQQNTLELYSDLPKHQATALFLLRTEVIGLNSWLAAIRVPDIRPGCGCGWRSQTVTHVLTMCPLYSGARTELIRNIGSESIIQLLAKPGKAQAIAKWFTQQGILGQFNLANEIEEGEAEEGEKTPFPPLREVV